MQARLRSVGVLGGMGPEATVHFMRRLIKRVDARDDSDHVPLLVDNNTQVPSRIKALIEGNGEDPAPVLAHMARRLETAGAEALVMPCNTAHNYADAVEQAVSITFISMVERTCDLLAARYPGGAIGLLASPAVMTTKVYDKPMRERGLSIVVPQDRDGLLLAIQRLKRSSRDDTARQTLEAAAADVATRGANAALIGCSEYSIISGTLAAPIPLVDSIDVLADATVAFSTNALEQGSEASRRLA